MSGNTYGKSFTLTTFGESHGIALGAIVGCPPGLAISKEYIQVGSIDETQANQTLLPKEKKKI